jgi:hypothetical protein
MQLGGPSCISADSGNFYWVHTVLLDDMFLHSYETKASQEKQKV